MRLRSRLLAGAAAATTSVGLALTGVGVLAPAHAAPTAGAPGKASALVDTDYGFQGTAYGTRLLSDLLPLESGRSAFSYLSCTRLAGMADVENLGAIKLPADNPLIDVAAIETKTRTFRDLAEDVDAGIVSTSRIGKINLGAEGMPHLSIAGLTTKSMAWATPEGKLKTDNVISSADIELTGIVPEEVPAELREPLVELLEAVQGGIKQVVETILAQELDLIVIPGLGELSVHGFDRQVVKKKFAAASAFALRVHLYGPDMADGGGDDSTIGLGRSWARINRDVPSAVMNGVGYASNAQLLDGALQVGKMGEQALPCDGTDGQVLRHEQASVDLQEFVLEGLVGESFGEFLDSGAARAYTEGALRSLKLGPLEIRGIVGRANLKQNKAGEIVSRGITGSAIAEVLVDGESMGGLTPETVEDFPELPEIPGVLDISFFDKVVTKRGVKVSAVVIELAEGTPAFSELRLGNAHAWLKKY